jgi:hypothetical protein
VRRDGEKAVVPDGERRRVMREASFIMVAMVW